MHAGWWWRPVYETLLVGGKGRGLPGICILARARNAAPGTGLIPPAVPTPGPSRRPNTNVLIASGAVWTASRKGHIGILSKFVVVFLRVDQLVFTALNVEQQVVTPFFLDIQRRVRTTPLVRGVGDGHLILDASVCAALTREDDQARVAVHVHHALAEQAIYLLLLARVLREPWRFNCTRQAHERVLRVTFARGVAGRLRTRGSKREGMSERDGGRGSMRAAYNDG